MTLICQRKDIYLHLEKIKKQKITEMNQENQANQEQQNTQAQQPPQPAANNSVDNTVAVIAYITLIGFIIALIMHSNNKTKLGAFHLREMLGLIIFGVGLWIVDIIPYIGTVLYIIGGIGLFVLWLLGLINAINKEMKPLPLIGDIFQKWFATTF